MLELAQAIARGEWVSIAGDRVPLSGERTVYADFLALPRHFHKGPGCWQGYSNVR